MKNYTVRVELHRADEDDYTRLHSLMDSAGFVRWIEGKSGALKRLPTAEYNMTDTSLTRAQVLARAKNVANSVKPRPVPWILVTNRRAGNGPGFHPGTIELVRPDLVRRGFQRRGIKT